MRKILYISDYSFWVPGGAQKSMEIIMEGLYKEYDFYALMPGKKYNIHEDKYKTICIDSIDDFLVNISITQTLKVLTELRKVICELKPDIVHAHMVSGMSAIEVLKAMHLINCPVVYTERGVADQYSRITRLIIKMMVKNFDRIAVTTHYNQELYKELYNVENDKICVIPNTAGSQFEKFEPNKKKIAKKELGFSKQVIMFNARMTYNKNWEMSIEIIKWMARQYDYQYIVVIGSDQTRDDIEKCWKCLDEIKNIVGTNNLKSYVDISLDQLNELYYAADVFIMTSRSESFGRTAVEAMSRAAVVFGTNIDGLSEVIGNDNYKFNDVNEFQYKFQGYLNRDAETESKWFLNRFRTQYSLERNISAYRNLYESVL